MERYGHILMNFISSYNHKYVKITQTSICSIDSTIGDWKFG